MLLSVLPANTVESVAFRYPLKIGAKTLWDWLFPTAKHIVLDAQATVVKGALFVCAFPMLPLTNETTTPC